MARLLEFDAEKKALFLDALVRSECIRAAAAEAGVLPGSVEAGRMRLILLFKSMTAYCPVMTSAPRVIVTLPSSVQMPEAAL